MAGLFTNTGTGSSAALNLRLLSGLALLRLAAAQNNTVPGTDSDESSGVSPLTIALAIAFIVAAMLALALWCVCTCLDKPSQDRLPTSATVVPTPNS